MSFTLFTDSSANLTEEQFKANNIEVVSLTLSINDKEVLCYEPGVVFDSEGFFRRMREESTLETKTSMINTAAFLAAFEPHLQAGRDILYLAMSGGISGTCEAGQKAAEILMKKYPDRTVRVIDTLTATIGEGMIVLEAAALRKYGAGLADVAARALQRVSEMNSYFMVDDLNFLKRGGRISGSAALAGSIVHLKPILKGDEEGRIVLDLKILGRKKALTTLTEIFRQRHLQREDTREIGIVHTGAEEDAHLLAADIIERYPDVTATVSVFEPCTASHVGPGAVGLFFY